MYEHTVTYVSVQYQPGESEGLIFKRPALQTDPDPASLASNANFERLFASMGRDGWELVSVQPLLRGQFDRSPNINASFGLGYSITAGYYFFWRRSTPSA
jgi:hypothetical protein